LLAESGRGLVPFWISLASFDFFASCFWVDDDSQSSPTASTFAEAILAERIPAAGIPAARLLVLGLVVAEMRK
jgi:hypothetical protein